LEAGSSTPQSWRLIFLVNIPLSILTVWVAATKVPESIDPTAQNQRLDVPGAALVAVGLAGTTYALIQSPEQGFMSSQVLIPGLVGIIALIAFVVVEQRSTHPMLPLDLFKSRQFTGANLVTVSIYAALGGFFFLLVVHLQVTLGYSALQAGAATIPMTFMMLFLSARAGAVADKIGPRLPMTVGPLTISVAMLLMTRIDEGADYLTMVLPAVLVFGLGLAMTVAPLTAAVLGAADQRHAGIASGVNNTVARAAQLTAIAVLPGLAGISGSDFSDATALSEGFSQAALITAGLAALGGLIAFVSIRRPLNAYDDEIQHEALHCCLDGPPLRSTAPRRIESLQ
jgi:predicted MFS family arabinose efflux permease